MADTSRNTNADEPKTPRAREIRRNRGQLRGGLDEVLPCIYLAGMVSAGEMRGKRTDAEQGFFAVGGSGDEGSVVSHLGLLLPVSQCRHERTRTALLKIPSLLADAANASTTTKHLLVDSSIREAFDSDLDLISDRVTVDRFWPENFFELKPAAALFRRLHEAFDYVTEVTDNPAGHVRMTNTAPFGWKSYVDLLKWRNLHLSHRFDHWTSLVPLLLCSDTWALTSSDMTVTEWRSCVALDRPDRNPVNESSFRTGLSDAQPFVRLDKNEAGWSDLHVGLDEATAAIRLSHVFDPFPDIVSWACAIDEGELPVEIRIDEESSIVVLTALATSDQQVLLRVMRTYKNTILLEGIVERSALAGAFKDELRRFFTQDFNTREWDDGDALKALVLAHPWLAADD